MFIRKMYYRKFIYYFPDVLSEFCKIAGGENSTNIKHFFIYQLEQFYVHMNICMKRYVNTNHCLRIIYSESIVTNVQIVTKHRG